MTKFFIGTWMECYDESAYQAALELARGCYQRALVRGEEALSGSTLKGTAKSYSGRYKASAENLISRLDDAGVPVRVERRYPGARRVLVIGEPPFVAWEPSAAELLGGAS